MKEKLQYRYRSTSLALKELNELGYTIDFNVDKNYIIKNLSII